MFMVFRMQQMYVMCSTLMSNFLYKKIQYSLIFCNFCSKSYVWDYITFQTITRLQFLDQNIINNCGLKFNIKVLSQKIHPSWPAGGAWHSYKKPVLTIEFWLQFCKLFYYIGVVCRLQLIIIKNAVSLPQHSQMCMKTTNLTTRSTFTLTG